jgi:hypothetical protein
LPDPTNLHKEPLRVRHADLERWSTESAYKSKCPTCSQGLLLVHRHPETFELINLDHCVSCGQRFIYEDSLIGGEPVRDVLDVKPVQDAMNAADEHARKGMN